MISPPIHLRLPEDLRDAVQQAAKREERTTADMLRLLIKRGLAVPLASVQPNHKPDGQL